MLLVLVLAVGSLAVADDAVPPNEAPLKSLAVRPGPVAPFRTALDTRLDVDFADIPFATVIARLEKQGRVRIRIDEIALEEEGIPLDEPITLRGRGARLEALLGRLLEPLGLTWIAKNDTLLVTSTIVAEELGNLSWRTYDVRSLLKVAAAAPRSTSVERSPRVYPRPPLHGRIGGGLPGLLPPRDPDPNRTGYAVLTDILFRATGFPELWEDQGGQGKVVPVPPGLLAVRQTQRAHEEVDRVLAGLHAMTSAKPGRPLRVLTESAAERRLRLGLDHEVSVAFEDTPLADVVDKLAEIAKCDFTIDVIALEEEGIPLDEPITVEIRDVSLRSALRAMFEPWGLIVHIRHEAYVLTSTIVAKELGNLEIAIADLRPLRRTIDGDQIADMLERTTGAPEDWESQGGPASLAPLWGEYLVIRQSLHTLREIEEALAELALVEPDDDAAPPRDGTEVRLLDYTLTEHDAAEVEAMIREFVPAEWDEPAGGVVRTVGRQLFIRTTLDQHDRIHRLLSRLRAKPLEPEPEEPATDRKPAEEAGDAE